MLNLTAEHLAVIKAILQKYIPGCEVWAFGSRLNTKVKKYADLDLAIVGNSKLSLRKIAQLREAFEESELPFSVDLLDWHRITPEFQRIISKRYIVI